MSAKKKVAIVDDHETFRKSLKQIIDIHTEYEVIGEAEDACQGEQIVLKFKPDLVVVDLSLPDKSGIQLTSILRTIVPSCQVVIVSMHSKIDYITAALRAGALGYLVKESVSHCLIRAFDAAICGEFYLDSALSGEIAQKILESEAENITNQNYGDLTSREQEILRLLAQGITTKKIAEQLFISPKTVTNHRANIMGKLELHSTVDLVRYAASIGIISSP